MQGIKPYLDLFIETQIRYFILSFRYKVINDVVKDRFPLLPFFHPSFPLSSFRRKDISCSLQKIKILTVANLELMLLLEPAKCR